jgi:RNA-directed DNA polymerase
MVRGACPRAGRRPDPCLRAFQDKLRAKTGRRRGDSLGRIVGDLNPLPRGRFGYFEHARPRLFRRLDQPLRGRLRAIPRTRDRRPSMGRSEADHRRWTNACFAAQGLFTLQTAFAAARRPR